MRNITPSSITPQAHGWRILVSLQTTTPVHLDFIESWYHQLNASVSSGFKNSSSFSNASVTADSRSIPVSGWVRIMDTLKKDNGKVLRKALVDLLARFPNYDLLLEKGVEEAIRDIEKRLGPVATFEEVK